jgi:phospholipid-binding lipoprotein MlaA
LFTKLWRVALLLLISLAPSAGYGFQEGDGAPYPGPSPAKSGEGGRVEVHLIPIYADHPEGHTSQVRLAAAGIEVFGGVDAPGYTLILSNPGSQGSLMLAQAKGDEEFEEEEEVPATIPDPFKSVNYALFEVNDKLYVFFFRPIAVGYKAVVPDRVRVGVKNMFENLAFPVRFVNCLLQGKVEGAFSEMGRFLLNTFCGVAGFVDVASEGGAFKRHDEDLDQTLGVYGLGQGFYIFWPVLGPSSARGTVGMAGDYFLNPLVYIETTGVLIGVVVFWQINNLSLRVDEYDAFRKAALDPYAAMRNAYYQNRKAKIKE